MSDLIDATPDVSLYPPHLVDSQGRNLPAALIPFCSYQGDSTSIGRSVENLSFKVCDKFQPTVLSGQLCYSIDVGNFTKARPKAGKAAGLTLLLDHANQNNRNVVDPFKIILGTLDGFSDSLDGSYRMATVKKMVGTRSFMALSDRDKKCQKEAYQSCHIRRFLDRIKRKYSCVPWALAHLLKVSFCVLDP